MYSFAKHTIEMVARPTNTIKTTTDTYLWIDPGSKQSILEIYLLFWKLLSIFSSPAGGWFILLKLTLTKSGIGTRKRWTWQGCEWRFFDTKFYVQIRIAQSDHATLCVPATASTSYLWFSVISNAAFWAMIRRGLVWHYKAKQRKTNIAFNSPIVCTR